MSGNILQYQLGFKRLNAYANKRRGSTVGIVIGYGLDDRGVGVQIPVGSRIFTSPCHPYKILSPPSLLSNG
jgi:hypothetical protein